MFNMPTAPEHIERYNRLPEYVRIFLEYPELRKFWLPVAPAAIGLAVSIPALLAGSTAPLLPLGLGIIGSGSYLARYLKNIKPKDLNNDGEIEPIFAQHLLFGSRTAETFDEGFVMTMPGSTLVERSKEQFNEDITIGPTLFRLDTLAGAPSDSFHKAVAYAFNTPAPASIGAGGSANVTIGITFERDWTQGHSVLDYDDVGESIGALDIIKDAVEADLREIGRRINWLQATFATDLLSAHLITKLTGEKLFEGYEIFKYPKDDFVDYIQRFLTDVRINGRSYVHGLGLRIRRLEVKSVDPVGKLKDAAEKAAVQRLERVALGEDVEALKDAVESLRTDVDDGSLSYKEALNIILVNDTNARVEKRIFEVEASQIDNFANAIKRWFESKGGS